MNIQLSVDKYKKEVVKKIKSLNLPFEGKISVGLHQAEIFFDSDKEREEVYRFIKENFEPKEKENKEGINYLFPFIAGKTIVGIAYLWEEEKEEMLKSSYVG